MARPPRIGFSIDVRGLSKAQQAVKRLELKHAMPDLLDDIGEVLADRVRASIAAGRTAAGRPAPKPKTGDRRALVESGALLAAVRHVVNGNKVRIGSTAPYSGWLQYGRKGMRPGAYLATAKGNVVKADKRTISDITLAFMKQRFAGVSGGLKARKAR